MKIERSSGVLMHISSLPGRHGTGTLGQEAYDFADFLCASGQSFWQVLPLGPVCSHVEYCPYVSPSAFAGNHLLISLDLLSKKIWFPSGLVSERTVPVSHTADFRHAETLLLSVMQSAFTCFNDIAPAPEKERFESFCRDSSWWLDDYALFMALSSHFGTYSWITWEESIRIRRQDALDLWNETLSSQILFHKFLQFIFHEQWLSLKQYCNERRIGIIGDIPIYVSFDSSDAWAHPEIFQLDNETGKPAFIAGVPPDYFSETGQRWGNPLYDWFDESGGLNRSTLQWWKDRLRQMHSYVDVIRIDHFRAFEDYWAIPEEEETAVKGEWRSGPGKPFFDRIREDLGELPFIAEDLGIITRRVEQLRDDLGFPGMKILQFAFDGNPKNSYLPFNYESTNCIVYTGTHDNDTSNGWYYESGLHESYKSVVRSYIGFSSDDGFHEKLMRYAYGTVAKLVIIPVQDILGYGSSYRMNIPGRIQGNWIWMAEPGSLTDETAAKMRDLTQRFNRIPCDK